MVELGSPVFNFLIYFIVGWFVTRYMEGRIRDRTGEKPWATIPFVCCVVLWLPLLFWGCLTWKRKN